MLDNTWNFHEAPEGLTFEHVCSWEPLTLPRMAEKLKNYHIISAFEDAGNLFLLMSKDGNYKLVRITIHDGNHEINTMDLLSLDAKLILKRYCNE